jgi:hypothetical protein
MGCCESIPTAPDVILPDPDETSSQVFSLKSMGMFTSDKLAYQGEATDDDTKKWYFVNKTGSGNSCIVELENFSRGGNEAKPEQGQILWSCSFDDSPQFQKQYKSATNTYTRFASNFGQQFMGQEDQNDEKYFQSSFGMNDGGYRRTMKWQLNTAAKIIPGIRGVQFGEQGFQLQVYARGTSIADYDQQRNEETGEQYYSKQEAEFVDQLCFQLVQTNTQSVVATWEQPGDFNYSGNPDPDKEMSNQIFQMKMRGGWTSSKKPLVTTTEGWDSTFGLMVAFLCAYEFSPNEIKNDLDTNFPDSPFGFGGW